MGPAEQRQQQEAFSAEPPTEPQQQDAYAEAGAGAAETAGLLQEANWIQRELRGLAQDHLTLAALETRQAGEALVRIIVLAVVAAALVFSAWLGLLAALVVLWSQQTLFTPLTALLLAVLLNGLLVLALVPIIRGQSRKLLLSATINSLQAEAEAVSQGNMSQGKEKP